MDFFFHCKYLQPLSSHALFVIPGCTILRRGCFLSSGPGSPAGILESCSFWQPVLAQLLLAEVKLPQHRVAMTELLSWRTPPWGLAPGQWGASRFGFSVAPSRLAPNPGLCLCLAHRGSIKSPSEGTVANAQDHLGRQKGEIHAYLQPMPWLGVSGGWVWSTQQRICNRPGCSTDDYNNNTSSQIHFSDVTMLCSYTVNGNGPTSYLGSSLRMFSSYFLS